MGSDWMGVLVIYLIFPTLLYVPNLPLLCRIAVRNGETSIQALTSSAYRQRLGWIRIYFSYFQPPCLNPCARQSARLSREISTSVRTSHHSRLEHSIRMVRRGFCLRYRVAEEWELQASTLHMRFPSSFEFGGSRAVVM